MLRQRVYAQLYPVLYTLWKRRYMLVVPIFIMPIIAVGISFLSPKKYFSQTTVLVQEASLLNPFLEDFSISYNLEQRIVALRVLVQSRYILNDVVHTLQLAEPGNKQAIQHQINLLAYNLKLELKGTDLVQLSLLWHNPEQMPDILTLVSERFLDRLRAPGKASVDNSELFLKSQLSKTQKELEHAEEALADFKTQHADNLPQLQGKYATTSVQLEEKRKEAELSLLRATAQRADLRQRLIQTNPIIGLLEEEVIKTEAELTILRSKYTGQHSKVKALQLRLSTLKEECARLLQQQNQLTEQELTQLWQRAVNMTPQSNENQPTLLLSQFEQLQQAETAISSLNQEIALLNQQKKKLKERQLQFANLEKSLKALQRNYDVKAKLYDQLLERYELAQVTGQLGRFEDPNNLQVIEQPNKPQVPINWPWWMNAIIGVISGIGLGLALTCFFTLIDSQLYYSAQIEKLSGVPILARIPGFDE